MGIKIVLILYLVILQFVQLVRVIFKSKNRLGGVYNESYVGPKKRGVMMEYLAQRFNFT